MKQHLLQSPYWEKFENIERKKTFRIEGKGFSILAVLEPTPLGKYLFCPYGPAVDEGDRADECMANLQTALSSLSELAREQDAFFVRIEPTCCLGAARPDSGSTSMECRGLKSLGLKKSHDIDPAHTWVLDLTQPEEQIFANMEKEKGRLWRNYHKKNICIRQTQDPEQIPILVHLLEAVGAQDHFIPQKESHLRSQLESGFATLYIADLDGQPVAASLVYDDDSTRYYAHAAADFEHRKLAAGSILLVQMIVDAKAKGLKTFDFWGITTSTDKGHPWYGFTQFKKSFGGRQVDYAGTWDYPLKPFRYRIYQAIRKANRIRRKIHH